MSVILMTTVFYKALILQGEIWCWSLLGLKGLNNHTYIIGVNQQRSCVINHANRNFISPACDSPLAASVPDNRWTASSTLDTIKFGPHLARLSNTVETVGWCSPFSKEKKKRPFIQVRIFRFILRLFCIDLACPKFARPFDHSVAQYRNVRRIGAKLNGKLWSNGPRYISCGNQLKFYSPLGSITSRCSGNEPALLPTHPAPLRTDGRLLSGRT